MKVIQKGQNLWMGGVVAVIALAVGGFVYFTKNGGGFEGPVEKLTLGATIGSTLVWVAENQGYFADFGLDVTIKQYQAGKLAADALSVGEVDVSTSADFVIVKKSFQEKDLRIIATISKLNTMGFIGRRDRGIEKTLDLKGKK
ncbi:ABC transporter substrate-binding protein [bacterium AH-315-B06]|nr:ABC transporter substrate-binding protein [bacterium AH-315-B06]